MPESGAPGSSSIAWYIHCLLAASALSCFAAHWDISWHRSIGLVDFWTPPHLLVWICGLMAAGVSGWLIIGTTFRNVHPRAATVRLWGFRAPIGAFLVAWGVAAMFASFIFDAWWHTTYGIEEVMTSPPHCLLAAGLLAIPLGAMALIASHLNRAENELCDSWRRAYVYFGATSLILLMTLVTESTLRPYQHSAAMYRIVCVLAPAVLAGLAVVSGRRWAATTAAAIYTGFYLLMLWLLPLFPATPMVGPVFHRVSSMVPLEFPLWLLVPAALADVLQWKLPALDKMLRSLTGGTAFFLSFASCQWWFAEFLQSPMARNWFFGARYADFSTRPASVYLAYEFVEQSGVGLDSKAGMALALVCAMISYWAALTLAEWMKGTHR